MNNVVSLFSLYGILKDLYDEQIRVRGFYVNKMNCILMNCFNKDYYLDKKIYIFMCGYDYARDELYLVLHDSLNEIERYYFSVRDEMFVVTDCMNVSDYSKINVLMDDLKNLFLFYHGIRDFYKFYSNIGVVDSSLCVDFNLSAMYLKKNCLKKNSYVSFFTYTDECDFCGSLDDFNFTSNDYLCELKNFFISLDDCPSVILKKIIKK